MYYLYYLYLYLLQDNTQTNTNILINIIQIHMNILLSLSNTVVVGPKSIILFSEIIIKEFANPDTTEERANELLSLAYQFNIPQLEEMMSQFNFENKLNNLL